MTEKDKEIQDLRIELDKLKDENTQLNDFILFVIDQIIDEEYWRFTALDIFPELACRRLVKLGYLNSTGNKYWRA